MDPMLLEVENSGYGNGLPLEVVNINATYLPAEVSNMDPVLFQAVTSGDVASLERLLRANTDMLQQVTPMNDTPLHIAAGLGDIQIVEIVHRECPMLLNKQNSLGDTPLHRAARSGHFNIVSFLIQPAKSCQGDIEIGRAEEASESIRKRNLDMDTVIHEAVRGCHFPMAKMLITEDPALLSLVNSTGESALYMAVEKSNFNVVERILANDCYSYKGPNGRTALHSAIVHGEQGISKQLLDKKRELVKEVDDNRRTPLHFASALGSIDSVKLLLKYNISTTCFLDKTGYAPIHIAVQFGRLGVVKELLRFQPDLKDLFDRRGRNMLHIAIENQQVAVFRYIMKAKGFDSLLNGKDNIGNTPLHQATISGSPYIINILVRDKRVDIMAMNRKGYTALAVARSRRDESAERSKIHKLVLGTLLHAASPPWYKPHSIHNEISDYYAMGKTQSVESYRRKADSLLVVATLVATVTFAAGFTLPGGYQNNGPNNGKATLEPLKTFASFLLFDALGMYFSVGAVIPLIWLQFAKHVGTVRMILIVAQLLTNLALTCMAVAFMFGVNSTLSGKKGLNTAILLLGCILYSFCAIVFIRTTMQIQCLSLQTSKRWFYLLSWVHELLRDDKTDVSVIFLY